VVRRRQHIRCYISTAGTLGSVSTFLFCCLDHHDLLIWQTYYRCGPSNSSLFRPLWKYLWPWGSGVHVISALYPAQLIVFERLQRSYKTISAVSFSWPRRGTQGKRQGGASPSGSSTQTTPATYTDQKCYLFCRRPTDVPLRRTVSRSWKLLRPHSSGRSISGPQSKATPSTLLIWSSTLSPACPDIIGCATVYNCIKTVSLPLLLSHSTDWDYGSSVPFRSSCSTSF